MSILTLDLHAIYNDDRSLERELRGVIEKAVAKRIKTVEIIPGKGSGQLKKRVTRFLQEKEIRALYHRIENDDKNHGRLFVHFKF